MRFEDEQYIRLYKRDTTTWLMLNWQGRCILPLIFRKLDRAGLLDLEEDGYEALAAHIQVPIEVVEEGMKSILKRKALILRDDGLLFAPRFIEAQEAKQSDKARQKASRDRARDLAAAAAKGLLPTNVTLRNSPTPPPSPSRADNQSPQTEPIDDAPTDVTRREAVDTPRDAPDTPRDKSSHTVTAGHDRSQSVTLSCAVLSSAQLSPKVSRARMRTRTREEPDKHFDPEAVADRPSGIHPVQRPKPPPSESAARIADPTAPEPDWWGGVLETVALGAAVDLPRREAWLRYAGHRSSKRRPAERGDAVHWLTTVMVKEAREARDKARHQRDIDAKWDKERERQRDSAGAPQPYHAPFKPPPTERRATPQEQAEAMKRLTKMIGGAGT